MCFPTQQNNGSSPTTSQQKQNMSASAVEQRPSFGKGGVRSRNRPERKASNETPSPSNHPGSPVAESIDERAVSQMYVKTKFCRFFGMGACSRGATCTYAHDREELRRIPDFQCTKLCPMLISQGTCGNANCRYAHDKTELRKRSFRKSNGIPPSPVKGCNSPMGMDEFGNNAFFMSNTSPVSSPELSAIPMTAIWPLPQGLLLDTTTSSIDGTPASPEEDDSQELHVFTDGLEDGCGMFFKTKLCQYHAKGKCTKGDACSFAHAKDALRPLPDLSYTQICPMVVSSGKCTNIGCKYAHTREQLRKLSRGSEESTPTCEGTQAIKESDDGTGSSPRTSEDRLAGTSGSSTTDSASMGSMRVVVKNTFLCVGPMCEAEGLPSMRKVHSAPNLLEEVCDDGLDDDDFGEDMWTRAISR